MVINVVISSSFNFEKLIRMADGISSIGADDYRKAIENTIPTVQRLVRQLMISNLKQSGLKRRSGELENAVANTEVFLRTEGKGGHGIVIAMPRNKSTESYKKYGSLNYGSVRSTEFTKKTEKIVRAIGGGFEIRQFRKVGAKKKAKLKKNLQNAGDSNSRQISGGTGLIADKQTVKVNKYGSVEAETNLGGVTVTKAFNFFKLSNSQWSRVLGVLNEGVKIEMDKIIKSKMK